MDYIETINDNPRIKEKRRFAKWLGVSYATVNKMLLAGLPVRFVKGIDLIKRKLLNIYQNNNCRGDGMQ